MEGLFSTLLRPVMVTDTKARFVSVSSVNRSRTDLRRRGHPEMLEAKYVSKVFRDQLPAPKVSL